MKQLPDFDLSIVIPFYEHLDVFKLLPLSKIEYYDRNGIEVVIIVENRNKCEVLEYVEKYPFICWKVVVSTDRGIWRNPARAFNAGIKLSSKQYVLIMDPEMEFYTDVIYELRENLDFYIGHYAIGQNLIINVHEEINKLEIENCSSDLFTDGCIMVKKEYLELLGGYCENNTKWEEEKKHLQNRLELAGIRRLFFPGSIVICRKDSPLQEISFINERVRQKQNITSAFFLPFEINPNGLDWGNSVATVVYDWKEHTFAKQQCKNYLSTMKLFDILSNKIFEESYPLIALIPVYNESKHIKDCLRSIEKYCDGIILLDDDSIDNTYQLAKSDKLLVKAKKTRIEFNDKENRNILLDIASFFNAQWFIFIDADERFDDRFVDLKEVMKRPDVDTVGVWIANLWDNINTYRSDMEDTNPNSRNGFWFRWRMFRNKGRMQIRVDRMLHFSSVPYRKENRSWKSKSLLLHLGYLDKSERMYKYLFYQKEDRNKILNYNEILDDEFQVFNIKDITLSDFL